jgi:hypothetical protein
MGFSFRKSVKFGPLRLNLSKSGIGISAGVKGARISTGPRGTQLRVGRKGFQYQKTLSSFSAKAPHLQQPGQIGTTPPPQWSVHGSPEHITSYSMKVPIILLGFVAILCISVWYVALTSQPQRPSIANPPPAPTSMPVIQPKPAKAGVQKKRIKKPTQEPLDPRM